MILNNVTTAQIMLMCSGESGFIKRKSGQIKIPSNEERQKITNQVGKTKSQADIQKSIDLQKKFPKLENGDIVIAGPDTTISITSSYNTGKDKPIEGMKARASKSLTLYANSEAKISGIERWDRKDNKTQTQYCGEMIKTIEVLKGTFACSYSRTDDDLLTPVAIISFLGEGASGTFDFYQDNLYCWPIASESIGSKGGVKFTNRFTKKSYQPKLSVSEEVIVTKDAIFRKPMTKMDEFPTMKKIMGPMLAMTEYMMPSPETFQNQVKHLKEMPKIAAQGMAGLEMMKNMSPEDLERLMMQAGQKVSPEQIKQIKEGQARLKEMEKNGMLGEMKKSMAMMKGYSESLGDSGIESTMNVQSEAYKKASQKFDEMRQEIKKADAKPKNYGPLTAEFKVA